MENQEEQYEREMARIKAEEEWAEIFAIFNHLLDQQQTESLPKGGQLRTSRQCTTLGTPQGHHRGQKRKTTNKQTVPQICVCWSGLISAQGRVCLFFLSVLSQKFYVYSEYSMLCHFLILTNTKSKSDCMNVYSETAFGKSSEVFTVRNQI